MHNTKILSLLFVISITTACGGEFDQTYDDTEDAIVGNPIPSWNGVTAITIQGDPQLRAGTLIAADLIITSNRWVTGSTIPSNVTVQHGSSTSRGRWITVNGYLPFAVIQVDPPFTIQGLPARDTRTQSALQGVLLSCYAFRTTTDLRRAPLRVIGSTGSREFTVGPDPATVAHLDDFDAGAPCFDGPTLSGIALRNLTANTSEVFAIANLNEFIDDMRFLGGIRTQARNFGTATGPYNFYLAPLFPATNVMCADLAGANPYDHADVNQYPCHFGATQQWYFDWSLETNNARIVSAVSGKCIDVPGGFTNDGVALQMYTCHLGDNQRFGIAPFPNNSGGYRITPKHSASQGRCVGARGGPSLNAARLEQQTCLSSNNLHQRWIFRN